MKQIFIPRELKISRDFFPLSFAESLAKNLPLLVYATINGSTNPLFEVSLLTFFP